MSTKPAADAAMAGDSTVRDAGGADPDARPRVTEFLHQLVATWPAERIPLGGLLHALGDRGMGLLMLLFALPALVPIPMFGLSSLLGTPVVILAVQMMLGRHEPWLPERLARRTLPRDAMASVILKARSKLGWLERGGQPGTLRLPHRGTELLAGTFLVINGLLLAAPIPWGNPAPAAAIVAMSLALAEADRRLFRIAIWINLAAIVIDLAIVAVFVGAAFWAASAVF